MAIKFTNFSGNDVMDISDAYSTGLGLRTYVKI